MLRRGALKRGNTQPEHHPWHGKLIPGILRCSGSLSIPRWTDSGHERQQTLTWDLPAPSGQEIPAIPLHQIRSCEFAIEALGSPWAGAGRGWALQHLRLSSALICKPGKRGGRTACQMDAAQKSHLVYGGFGGLGEEEKRGNRAGCYKKELRVRSTRSQPARGLLPCSRDLQPRNPRGMLCDELPHHRPAKSCDLSLRRVLVAKRPHRHTAYPTA